MRHRVTVLIWICLAVAVFMGPNRAVAQNYITWDFLMHPSVAGKGPGPDGLIGTMDDTSLFGEKNTCNFVFEAGCEWTGSPTIGSYSFAALEVPDGVATSCLLGDTPGQPCISGPCSPLGDYCPGNSAVCIRCPQKKDGPDSFTYFGADESTGGSAYMWTCQEYDGAADPDPSDGDGQTEFAIFAFQAFFTEPFLGVYATTLNLEWGAPQPFIGSPCGVGSVSGSFNVSVTETFAMPFSGDVIDMDNPVAASCAYSLDDVNALISTARSVDPEAEYLMILCGSSTLPTESEMPCLAGGTFDFVLVFHTKDDASQCPDNGCGTF